MTQMLRLGVVAVVRNHEGAILIGKRSDCRSRGRGWQLPQGGIEAQEAPEAAALRELREEMGVAEARILACTLTPIDYFFPAEMLLRARHGGVGQRQYWLLMELVEPAVPTLAHSDHTFTRVAWVSAEEALARVVAWKAPAYRAGLQALGLLPRLGAAA